MEFEDIGLSFERLRPVNEEKHDSIYYKTFHTLWLIIKTHTEDNVAILSAQILTFKSSRNLTLLTHSGSVT